MNTLQILAKLFPVLLNLMRIAETEYSTPGSGEQKKVDVLNVVQTLVPQTTWSSIDNLISSTIDLLSIINFPKS